MRKVLSFVLVFALVLGIFSTVSFGANAKYHDNEDHAEEYWMVRNPPDDLSDHERFVQMFSIPDYQGQLLSLISWSWNIFGITTPNQWLQELKERYFRGMTFSDDLDFFFHKSNVWTGEQVISTQPSLVANTEYSFGICGVSDANLMDSRWNDYISLPVNPSTNRPYINSYFENPVGISGGGIDLNTGEHHYNYEYVPVTYDYLCGVCEYLNALGFACRVAILPATGVFKTVSDGSISYNRRGYRIIAIEFTGEFSTDYISTKNGGGDFSHYLACPTNSSYPYALVYTSDTPTSINNIDKPMTTHEPQSPIDPSYDPLQVTDDPADQPLFIYEPDDDTFLYYDYNLLQYSPVTQLYYTPIDYTYTVNDTYTYTYYLNYTNITYIGSTEDYNSFDVYYALPDGRSSADLTSKELENISLNFDVINYGKSTDDGRLRALYHFDGETVDSSYFYQPDSFTWNYGASIAYVDSTSFGGALLLDEAGHSFDIKLPTVFGNSDFSIFFRYYHSAYINIDNNLYLSANDFTLSVGGTDLLTSVVAQDSSSSDIPVGSWNEVGIIRDGNHLYTYLNGIVYDDSSLNVFLSDTLNFEFEDIPVSRYFDELRVFNYAFVQDGASYTPIIQPQTTNLVLVLPNEGYYVDPYYEFDTSGNLYSFYDFTQGVDVSSHFLTSQYYQSSNSSPSSIYPFSHYPYGFSSSVNPFNGDYWVRLSGYASETVYSDHVTLNADIPTSGVGFNYLNPYCFYSNQGVGYPISFNGVTIDYSLTSGQYTLSGSVSSPFNYYLMDKGNYPLPNGTYKLSGGSSGCRFVFQYTKNGQTSYVICDSAVDKEFTVDDSLSDYSVFLAFDSNFFSSSRNFVIYKSGTSSTDRRYFLTDQHLSSQNWDLEYGRGTSSTYNTVPYFNYIVPLSVGDSRYYSQNDFVLANSNYYSFSLMTSDGNVYSVSGKSPSNFRSYKTNSSSPSGIVSSYVSDFDWGTLTLIFTTSNGDSRGEYQTYVAYVLISLRRSIDLVYREFKQGSPNDQSDSYITVIYDDSPVDRPTIAVHDVVEVNTYRVGGVRPTIPQYGDVWFQVSNSTITSCQIYTGYVWKEVDCRIWTGKHWASPQYYNIITLQDYSDIADNTFTPTFTSDTVYYDWTANQWSELFDMLKAISSKLDLLNGGGQVINVEFDYDGSLVFDLQLVQGRSLLLQILDCFYSILIQPAIDALPDSLGVIPLIFQSDVDIVTIDGDSFYSPFAIMSEGGDIWDA